MKSGIIFQAALFLLLSGLAQARNGGNETPRSILAYSFEAASFAGGSAGADNGWSDFMINLTEQGYIVTRYNNDTYDDDPEGCTITNLVAAGHSGVLAILYAHSNSSVSSIEVYETAAARDAAYDAYVAAGWNAGGTVEISKSDTNHSGTEHYNIRLNDLGFANRLKSKTTMWETIVILSGCCNSIGLFDDLGGRVRFANDGCPGVGPPTEWQANVALLLERMSGFKDDGNKRPAGDAFGAGGFGSTFKIDGEGKTTLCPVVLAHSPVNNVPCSDGVVLGSVTFDTGSFDLTDPTDIIRVSANAILVNAIWATPRTKIDFTVGNVSPGETITITVDAANLLSDHNVTNLDGNQNPGGTDGTRPNEDNFVWTFSCVDAPTDSTGSCCLPSGECQGDLTIQQCQAAHGTYQGDNTSCAYASCPLYEVPALSGWGIILLVSIIVIVGVACVRRLVNA